MSENKASILILFKERKKETPNSFFYERKYSREYNTIIIFISDYLSQSNHKIAESINPSPPATTIASDFLVEKFVFFFNTNFFKFLDFVVVSKTK